MAYNKYTMIDAQGVQHAVWTGENILSTGGGTEAITVAGVQIGDRVFLSLKSDDTGTPIIKLVGEITAANTLTIVRTDDGSSNDDAVCYWRVERP